MKTVISAVVGLLVGVLATYMYMQGPLKTLQGSVAGLETQLTEAKTAAESAAGEVTKLQEAGKALESQLAEAKTQAEAALGQVTSLQGKVTELEAALTAAKQTSQ
jgi:chromosome segregation ATPase